MARAFADIPPNKRRVLKAVRKLIYQTAAEPEGVGGFQVVGVWGSDVGGIHGCQGMMNRACLCELGNWDLWLCWRDGL